MRVRLRLSDHHQLHRFNMNLHASSTIRGLKLELSPCGRDWDRSYIWNQVRLGILFARTENGFVYIYGQKPELKPTHPVASSTHALDFEDAPEETRVAAERFIAESVHGHLQMKTEIAALASESNRLRRQVDEQTREIAHLKQMIEDY